MKKHKFIGWMPVWLWEKLVKLALRLSGHDVKDVHLVIPKK